MLNVLSLLIVLCVTHSLHQVLDLMEGGGETKKNTERFKKEITDCLSI